MEDGYIQKTLEILKLAGFNIDEDSGNITRPDHFLSMVIGEYNEDTYETLCYYDYILETEEDGSITGTVNLPDTSNIRNLAIAIRDYFNEDKERCDKLAKEVIALYQAVNEEDFGDDNEGYKVEEISARLPDKADYIKQGVVYITTYAVTPRRGYIVTASPYNYITKQIRLSGKSSYDSYSDDLKDEYIPIDINNVAELLKKLSNFHDLLYELFDMLIQQAEGPDDNYRNVEDPPDRDPPGWD